MVNFVAEAFRISKKNCQLRIDNQNDYRLMFF